MKLKRRERSGETHGDGLQMKLHVHDVKEADSTLKGLAAFQKIAGTEEFAAVDSAVQAVFVTRSSHDAEKVVNTLKARLLSDAAVGLLALHESLSRNRGDASDGELYALYRRLLLDCRTMGIGAAFDAARRRGVEAYIWET